MPPHLAAQLVQAGDGTNDGAFLHQSDLPGNDKNEAAREKLGSLLAVPLGAGMRFAVN